MPRSVRDPLQGLEVGKKLLWKCKDSRHFGFFPWSKYVTCIKEQRVFLPLTPWNTISSYHIWYMFTLSFMLKFCYKVDGDTPHKFSKHSSHYCPRAGCAHISVYYHKSNSIVFHIRKVTQKQINKRCCLIMRVHRFEGRGKLCCW